MWHVEYRRYTAVIRFAFPGMFNVTLKVAHMRGTAMPMIRVSSLRARLRRGEETDDAKEGHDVGLKHDGN